MPDARANLALIPADLADEDVVLCFGHLSTACPGQKTAISGSVMRSRSSRKDRSDCVPRSGRNSRAQRFVIGIDSNPDRLKVARRLGANVTLNPKDGDSIAAIKRLTEGRGVDVAIEALGRQETFERASGHSSGRDVIKPRRLFRQTCRAVRSVLCRARRSENRHEPVPGWQRADATSHGDGGRASISHRW